ncbi:MAG: hypothetical protein EOP49_21330, partial [Sphingobacteriales bacterium]
QMIESVNVALSKANKEKIKIVRWCPCDSSLVLLEGKDLHGIKINGRELADGTRPSGGVSGDPPYDITFDRASNTLKWPQLVGDGSLNYLTHIPIETKTPSDTPVKSGVIFVPPLPTSTETPFIIAITDTGIRPGAWYSGFLNSFWANVGETTGRDNDHNGMAGDVSGWDFVHHSNNLYDPIGHGTRVTSLIHEQLTDSDWAINRVRFMFLKTHNEKGEGLLFDNLCALSYARQKGAKIINASWGFYNPHPSPLLNYFIKELSSSGILVVAAAGNTNATSDSLAETEWGIARSDLRNSSRNPFWPASHSFTFSNVISATTLHAEQKAGIKTIPPERLIGVCSSQNFSAQFVNVGVLNNGNQALRPPIPFCDIVDITNPNQTTSGSSYAAPVITGKLARHGGQTWTSNNRDDVLFPLLRTATSSSGSIMKSSTGLATVISNGNYVFRHDR